MTLDEFNTILRGLIGRPIIISLGDLMQFAKEDGLDAGDAIGVTARLAGWRIANIPDNDVWFVDAAGFGAFMAKAPAGAVEISVEELEGAFEELREYLARCRRAKGKPDLISPKEVDEVEERFIRLDRHLHGLLHRRHDPSDASRQGQQGLQNPALASCDVATAGEESGEEG